MIAEDLRSVSPGARGVSNRRSKEANCLCMDTMQIQEVEARERAVKTSRKIWIDLEQK